MKKIFILLGLVSTFSIYAQDPGFLNTNQSLINLNPSFAGSNGGVRNQFSYRSQWPSLSGSFVTYQNSLDFYIKRLHAGIAASWLYDEWGHGTLKSNAFNITYAQHLSFSDGDLKISPSIQAGYGIRTLDRDNLHFGDLIDPRYGYLWNNSSTVPLNTVSYANFSGGLLVNYKKNLYVGASLFNFNRPDIGMLGSQRIPARLSLHASYNIQLSEQTHLQAFYRYNSQGVYSYSQLALNAIFKNHFIAGIGYMTNSTLIANLGFRMGCFTLQGGYDLSFSNGKRGAGSWEIHGSLNFPNKEKYKANSNFENY